MASCARLAPIEQAPKVWDHWHAKEQKVICEFERECKRLHLDPTNQLQLLSSVPLRFWVRNWYKRKYVPEFLVVAFVPEYNSELLIWTERF